MSARKPARARDDYEIGYKRPPKASRFAPGQSGNPKGRPKGARSIGAILQEIVNQKVAVTENGKKKRVCAIEVMFRRLLNEAMRGDAKAIKLLLPLVDRYGDAPESRVDMNALTAEDQEILASYLGDGRGSEKGPSDEAEEERHE